MTSRKHKGTFRKVGVSASWTGSFTGLFERSNYSHWVFHIHVFCLGFQNWFLVVGDSLEASAKAQKLLSDNNEGEITKKRTWSSDFFYRQAKTWHKNRIWSRI